MASTFATPVERPAVNSTNTYRTGLGYYIGRVLQTILPKTWFCWISRGTIQLQSYLRPVKWSYWTKISEDIYLGAMPLKNRNHIETITRLGVKAILSVNEDYEFNNQLFAEPVKSTDWEAKGVTFNRISSPDLEPVQVDLLNQAVQYAHEQKEKGPVYFHCTGGRGRSASVVIATLMVFENITLQESIKRVQALRPQVMLSAAQVNSLQNWALALA